MNKAQKLSSVGRTCGFTLVELMVALAIGSFLLIGATSFYMQGRASFRVNEAVNRLQEDARYVLELMEPDIRMASYYGRQAQPTRIVGRATAAEIVPAGLEVDNDCGVNWTINLVMSVDGDNNGYNWNCNPAAATQATADTLVVKRVEEDPTLPANLRAGEMYLQSARFIDNRLFVGTVIPGGFTATNSATHRLVVNGYFVSQTSDVSTATNVVPSLRRWTLDRDAANGPFQREEQILPGVEDLQVQFGIDTDDINSATRGSVNRYVNPGDALLDPVANPQVQVLSVRLWLRIRAERPENGFVDDRNYVYADQDVGPFNDSFRRVLVSKTIFLRNTRSTI